MPLIEMFSFPTWKFQIRTFPINFRDLCDHARGINIYSQRHAHTLALVSVLHADCAIYFAIDDDAVLALPFFVN